LIDQVKSLLLKILRRVPSKEGKLLRAAARYPRFTPHRFSYLGLNIEVSDFLSVAWQIKEFFGDKRMEFKSNRVDPVIIDCGSNVGISALYFKSLFPKARIYCYEADPHIAEILRRNLENNGAVDVEVFQKVVWTHSNGVFFGSEGADGGSVHNTQNATFFPSVCLREVLQQREAIDLLKIDIEGAEVAVLQDCVNELHRVKYLYVEYHSFTDQPQELDVLLRLLKESGFRYYIHRIGAFHEQPFVKVENTIMDVQLDIHAIR
jgi:FkbM family methyltransferase